MCLLVHQAGVMGGCGIIRENEDGVAHINFVYMISVVFNIILMHKLFAINNWIIVVILIPTREPNILGRLNQLTLNIVHS